MDLPRAARVYIVAICTLGAAVLAYAASRVALDAMTLAQAALFIGLVAAADLKQIRLQSANYSVATAINFACAVLLGPFVAPLTAALGGLIGDLVLRKPPYKAAFNAASLGLAVAAGSAAMAAVRRVHDAPDLVDVPAFLLYALANAATNIVLVSLVISLATRVRMVGVVTANYRAIGVHFAVLWPLGLLMAVVYRAFGGAFGLMLLVAPMIAAYAALERARVLLCLGAIGWAAALAALDAPRPRGKFGHGAETTAGGLAVLGSFHVSQQNTFTGRLTPEMLDAVLARALALC